MREFLLQAKIEGDKRLLILRETCCGASFEIRIKYSKEAKEKLIVESEELEDIVKSLKRLDNWFCRSGFLLHFDEPLYEQNRTTFDIFIDLKSGLADEELMILGKIAEDEKETINSLGLKSWQHIYLE